MEYQYDRDLFLKSIFDGDTVYFETAFPIKGEAIQLLYPIEEIIAVTNFGLNLIYEEGRDYIVKNHNLVLTDNTRIPQMTLDEYYKREPEEVRIDVSKERCPYKFNEDRFLFFCEKDGTIKHQIAITYKHKPEPNRFKQSPQRNKLSRFFNKLKSKKETTIVFYGDSITEGNNASGTIYGNNVPPYCESWAEMITNYLADKYQTKINYVNSALGGMTTKWGEENYEERVNKYHPDLLVLAFGMNDGNLPKNEHFAEILTIIEGVKAKNPECDIVLISTTIPNIESTWFDGNQKEYITEYQKYDDPHVALVDMTTTHFKLLERKRFKDMTGNNINHPNDFLIRIYAQMILSAMEEIK